MDVVDEVEGEDGIAVDLSICSESLHNGVKTLLVAESEIKRG